MPNIRCFWPMVNLSGIRPPCPAQQVFCAQDLSWLDDLADQFLTDVHTAPHSDSWKTGARAAVSQALHFAAYMRLTGIEHTLQASLRKLLVPTLGFINLAAEASWHGEAKCTVQMSGLRKTMIPMISTKMLTWSSWIRCLMARATPLLTWTAHPLLHLIEQARAWKGQPQVLRLRKRRGSFVCWLLGLRVLLVLNAGREAEATAMSRCRKSYLHLDPSEVYSSKVAKWPSCRHWA